MMTTWRRWYPLLLLLLAVQSAHAEIAFNGYGGYAPLAQLDPGEGASSQALTLTPLQGEINYVMRAGKVVFLSVGASMLNGRVVYNNKGVTYAGTFASQGVSGGLGLALGSLQVFLQGESLLASTFSVRSQINSLVNAETFKHSTVITYKGTGGVLARFALLTELSNKQFARYTRMRAGFSLEAVQQPFSSKSLNINTSDPVVGAGGVWKTTPKASLQYLSASLMIGMIF